MSGKTFLSFLNKSFSLLNHLMENGKKRSSDLVCFALYRKPCCQYPVLLWIASLDYIDDILTMQPILPAKILVPIYIRAGESAIALNIFLNLSFCTESSGKIFAVFSSPKNTSLIKFLGKDGEDFEIHCSSAVLIVREN